MALRYIFLDGIAFHYHSCVVMRKIAPKKPRAARSVMSLDLSPELRTRLQEIGKRNGLNMAAVARMCLSNGLPIVQKKLMPPEKTEAASLPA